MIDQDAFSQLLPEIAVSCTIPKVVHQTFYSKALPERFLRIVDAMKAQNPDWEFRLYDDTDIDDYIAKNFGSEIVHLMASINPKYGAARADFFRYLVLYKEGGVYLDIKSAARGPLNNILTPGEAFIITQWDRSTQSRHASFGRQHELDGIVGGEFQQWQITTVAGHPFLKEVITDVALNIRRYRPWKHHTGQVGVLRLTGPIAYTLAINRILRLHKHRILTDLEAGYVYDFIGDGEFKRCFKGHYLTRTDSIVRLSGLNQLFGHLYSLARKAKRITTKWTTRKHAH